jgi:outer membrane immunogenic protein
MPQRKRLCRKAGHTLAAASVKENSMMSRTTTLSATIIATAFAVSPAFAGGPVEPVPEPIITPAPVIAPVSTGGEWGGFYVGAQLGYGKVTSGGAGLDGKGALGGVHAGYRYDFGKAVVGGELDYDLANISLDAPNSSLENVARLKLMAGADLGNTLIYGTVGGAFAKAKVGGTSLSDSGYFAGIGADYALTSQWSVGGEVLAHRFDNFDSSGVDLKATTATLRASFKF